MWPVKSSMFQAEPVFTLSMLRLNYLLLKMDVLHAT